MKIWNNLGELYSKKGEYDKAVQCYDNAIEKQPDKYDFWLEGGRASLYSGNFNKAKNYLQKGWELSHSKSHLTAMYLGHVFLLGDYNLEEAIIWYKKSSPLWKNKADFFDKMKSDYLDTKMGMNKLSQGNFDQLLEDLKEYCNSNE